MTEENKNQLNPNDYPLPAPHTPFSLEGHFQPWYDDRRDYNTNAPTYYDYLANFNKLYKDITVLLNRVARRNIIIEDTPCIDLTKVNDWIAEDNPCKTWHDDIILKADVILSNYKQSLSFDGGSYYLPNATTCLEDGIFTPDYEEVLTHLKDKLNKEIQDRIDADNNLRDELTEYIDNNITNLTNQMNQANQELQNQITALSNSVQKIVSSLYAGGNATSDNLNTYEITNNIACGNINVYGGKADGTSLIKTHNGQAENDVTIGAK